MPRKSALEQIGVDLPDEPPIDTPAEEPAPETPEQPDEQQPVEPDTPPPAEERPDWLPKQYKDEQAFADAHRSLQNELRIRGEREREYQQRLSDLEAQVQQSQMQSADPWQQAAAALEEARDAGDYAREAQINQWLVQQTVQQTLQAYQQQTQQQQQPQEAAQHQLMAAYADDAMGKRYPDWTDVKEEVAQQMMHDPVLQNEAHYGSLQSTINALDHAYKVVQYQKLIDQQQQLQQAGIDQAAVDRARKLQDTTLTGASGRAPQPSAADDVLASMKGALASSYPAQRGTG